MLKYFCVGSPEAPPIFFLHGAGITSVLWWPVARLLPEFYCVLIDLPGHGESRDIEWLSMSNTADRVRDVIVKETTDDKTASVGRGVDVHLVGLSLGSYVGLRLMGQEPNRVTTATLSGVHVSPMPKKRLMSAMMWVMAPLASRPFIARRSAQMLGFKGSDREAYVTEAAKTRTSALRRIRTEVLNFEAPANLEAVTTSALIIAGERERPTIKNDLAVIAARMQTCRTAVVPDVGHAWPIEAPELFAECIRAQVTGADLPVGLESKFTT